MKEWQILISDPIAPQGVEKLARHARVLEGSPEKYLGQVDALIVRSATVVNRSLLQAGAPRLQVVGRAGVGVDNIDLMSARDLGIRVVNAPQASTTAVAEHTFALMLALCRHIPEATARMRAGEWPKKELVGHELAGKTLGIIGLGRIGTEVARRAAVFEMRILAYDPYIDDQQERCGAQGCALDALLEQSDFVTLHLPLTEETNALIDRSAMKNFKPGSRIISTARGGLIDEDALLEALCNHQIAGAALDVFNDEPPKNSALIKHPNVVTTPHIAGQTVEAQQRVAIDIAEEVLAALEGKPLRWEIQ
ncbi:MAG: hydroxyacid dehydrogenase [Anaerolineales bacterium]|jgi:D-3-phosphoglycerate dehydrogenase